MFDAKYSELYKSILNNESIKRELKEAANVLVRTALNECYPYIYVCVGFVLLNFLMISAIFFLVCKRTISEQVNIKI